jgi:hypothetical protein
MADSSTRSLQGSPTPAVGTCLTSNTRSRAAKYGIPSVISPLHDIPIGQIRRFHCDKEGQPLKRITEIARYCEPLAETVRKRPLVVRNRGWAGSDAQ